MFSYYGSKASLVKHYPKPKYDTVIEYFAGSARYALRYWDKNVIISDKNEMIYRVWKYLQRCSPKDIMGLPHLKAGERISTYKKSLTSDERDFLGFLCNAGSASGSDVVSKFVGDITPALISCADQVDHIKHWTILNKTYFEVPDMEATHYLDPPYQFGGEHYMCSSKQISFQHLGKFCMNLKGQVMVCENTKATWLPFVPLVNNAGMVHKTVEAIWMNQEMSGLLTQTSLF